MRGEYKITRVPSPPSRELPPRARRILWGWGFSLWLPGTTSACAENTVWWRAFHLQKRNYLRVRGEYCGGKPWWQLIGELPPRARRIPGIRGPGVLLMGTTSACAENTPFWCGQGDYHGNYLRVRGEYKPTMWNVCWRPELPPRARRIPNMCSICHMICGTTSACAENTGRLLPGWMPARNYLRVRGEYSSTRAGSFLSMELPPRARRILLKPSMIGAIKGTTSACAENTRSQRVDLAPTWELPPRARRIQHVLCR